MRLESLAEFQKTLRTVLGDYTNIVDLLDAGNPTTTTGGPQELLGQALLPGSTRAYEASRTLIDNYTGLYNDISSAHDAMIARLRTADEALTDNREGYARHEATRESAFRDLAGELPGTAWGGDRGTAGTE
ncbi:hypothetical protein BLA60_40260 [Actinophytocola xinjiangensis]|uniref:Excreted virulence factor EspC (Type VII ESX diderm) n=1 Tax=Actinophytocola xinjiangensis TaxID=485602 RepID=A0A7Z0WCX8_9PSEU|nr:hypothetical protein [Actinophytocola xinjiangensis]OLF04527.1 hypothetical protein BLA60_40260 [Actinophytocola xinjiangensis]